MKLCYRGVTYQHKPLTLEVKEGEFATKDSPPWRYRYPRHVTPPPKPLLKYRGVCYVDTAIKTQKAKGNPELPSIPQWLALPRREVTQSHLENICRNIQHRLEAARQLGDEDLVSLIEEEYRQLNLVEC